jgi:hypothetical protein
MGRNEYYRGRKCKLRREECVSLSILDVVREGLIKPGERTAGWCKSLYGHSHAIKNWIPVRGELQENYGFLTVFEPYEQEIMVIARQSGIRWKRDWSFECRSIPFHKPPIGCGRLVRTLFYPHHSFFAMWGCRHCWNIAYPRGEEYRMSEEVARLERLYHHQREIATMIEVQHSIIARMRSLSPSKR